jgi:ribulose-bisphosphate carboxylase small chain
MLSFIVNRPDEEPGFRLERQDKADRQMRYALHPYAQEKPVGRRYGNEGDLATSRDPARAGRDGA